MPEHGNEDSEELEDLIGEETVIDWPRARSILSGSTTEELLALMSRLGLYVNRKLAFEIAGRKDAVFQLRRYLQDGGNWYDSERTSWWAPIHSIHILSLIKGPEALRLLLDVLRYRAEDLNDYLTEDVAALLYSFGPGVWTELKEFTLDETLPAFARSAALSAMVARSMKEPALKAETLSHLLGLLNGTEDTLFASLVADDLIKLDKAALPEVMAAYKEGRIDPAFSPEDEIAELASGEYDDVIQMELEIDTKDPLDHFTRKNILHLREVQQSWEDSEEDDGAAEAPEDSDGEDDEEGPKARKASGKKVAGKNGPARNAPCPCGSGKKYKRCCMPKPARR